MGLFLLSTATTVQPHLSNDIPNKAFSSEAVFEMRVLEMHWDKLL